MVKYFLHLAILSQFSTTLIGQAISYSTHPLTYSPDYQYCIVGNIKGNIIVWKTYLNQHSKSEIFVYDNSMKLIRIINTNILQSDMQPSLQFFAAKNSFRIFYQCKNQNEFLYKLGSFDELGNLTKNEILDSLNINTNEPGETFFYKLLRSENNKVACFAKMHFDSVKRVLKLDGSFIGDDTITKKNFIIQFDESHETLADIIVDDEKNILILKGTKNDSLVNLKLIKKNFSDEPLHVAEKSINTYNFEENSLHIAEKSGGYLVYGKLGKYHDTGFMRQTKLYVWQTDLDLNDFAADAVMNNDTAGNTINFSANIPANDKLANIFAAWRVLNPENGKNAYEWYNSHEQFASYKFVYPALKEYPFYYTGYFTIASIYLLPPYNRLQADYVKNPDTVNINIPQRSPINKIELSRLSNNNKIIWSHSFTDSIDDVTMADLSTARVVAGNKAIHIIYEINTSKKTKTLDHIVINADGTFSKGFVASWNVKYKYDLNKCVLTGHNEFIIPAIKGSKIRFAKMQLE